MISVYYLIVLEDGTKVVTDDSKHMRDTLPAWEDGIADIVKVEVDGKASFYDLTSVNGDELIWSEVEQQ